MKENIEEIVKAFSEIQASHDRFSRVMSRGPASYYFEKLIGYYEGCMAASKFKVKDKVKLSKDLDINKTSGWAHCAHFLVKGAKAKIVEVDYIDGEYKYGVKFDKETYLDEWNGFKKVKTPIEKPVTKKHIFYFNENSLDKA
jgi:hypothetical protein